MYAIVECSSLSGFNLPGPFNRKKYKVITRIRNAGNDFIIKFLLELFTTSTVSMDHQPG